MKILALHDGGSGCAHYRIKLPMEQLAEHGHEITYLTGTEEKPATLSAMTGYDIIVSQRQLSHRGLETWRKARGPFSRLVYETDDDVFSITADNFQAYTLYSREDIRDATVHGAEVADLVTVTTEYLATVMREASGNHSIAVLPNCIPERVLSFPPNMRQRPSIGWQGGASHGVDVGMLVKPVRQFLKRFPDWDFRLHGTDYRPTFKLGKRAVFSDWIPVYDTPDEYYASIDFDIGLAPLADTEFSRSKSDIKVLEYAALGIPSVATDCDVYRNFIKHGINGFLVTHDHEWLHYMSVLAGDAALRVTMGYAARETARERTIERNWRLWEQAYRELYPRVASLVV